MEKDTIPRLQQLVPHMRQQLPAMRQGGTFEDARRRYAETVAKLELQGVGRRTASRVGDKDAYWSPTAELLNEGVRLGLIERQQVPSARRYIEQHRDRIYRLTASGHEAADLAEFDIAGFCDRLAAAIYTVHPYFRALIASLDEAPIACPEITETDIDQAARDKKGTDYWADYAVEKIARVSRPAALDRLHVRQLLVQVVRRRFGVSAEHAPTTKALVQAVNDAFAVAALAARGVPIGAIEIDILKSWGSQLRVLDQSRYVTSYEGFNLIWPAADLDGAVLKRRDIERYQIQVARAVLDSYRLHAEAGHSRLSAPYVPIYKVRADAAFQCRVTRALVDMVIERLSEGSVPGVSAQVLLHLGTTRQPVSEPIYRRGRTRRYEITVHAKST